MNETISEDLEYFGSRNGGAKPSKLVPSNEILYHQCES